MKKNIPLTIVILKILEAIMYFIPFCVVREIWLYDNAYVYHGQSKLSKTENLSLFGYFRIPAIILLLLAVAIIAIYFLKASNKPSPLSEKAWLIVPTHTIAVLVCLVIIYVECWDTVNFRHEYAIGLLYYVIIGLSIVSTTLAILLKFGLLPKEQDTSHDISTNESLSELLTYKELLDCGAITKEEFELKKKEFLSK